MIITLIIAVIVNHVHCCQQCKMRCKISRARKTKEGNEKKSKETKKKGRSRRLWRGAEWRGGERKSNTVLAVNQYVIKFCTLSPLFCRSGNLAGPEPGEQVRGGESRKQDDRSHTKTQHGGMQGGSKRRRRLNGK